MAYLNDNAPSEEMSVVFLPARAAAVAMALSSLSSFAALAMLVRLALELSEISGENILLVACTASAFAIFVVASLTLAYARFLPPPFSRVWQLVSPVISFLTVMWFAGLGLSIALFVEVLHPFMTCDDVTCQTPDRDVAVQTLSVIVVALVSCFALAMLVSFDLRTTRHHANVIIYQSELQLRQKMRKQRQELSRQAQTVPLLYADPAWSSDEEYGIPSGGPIRSPNKDATLQAHLARAQQPLSTVDPLLAEHGRARPDIVYPPPGTGRDPVLPTSTALFSEGKKRRRHHHRPSSGGTSTTASPSTTRSSDSSSSTSSGSTSTDEEREKRKRREPKAHRSKSRSQRSGSRGPRHGTTRGRDRDDKKTASARVEQMVYTGMAPGAE